MSGSHDAGTVSAMEDVHVHLHVDLDVLADGRLHRIERKLDRLLAAQGEIMTDLTALDASVAAAEAATSANTDVTTSASVLLGQLADIIRANVTDPAALAALADRLSATTAAEESNNAALSAAVAANTPAVPTP